MNSIGILMMSSDKEKTYVDVLTKLGFRIQVIAPTNLDVLDPSLDVVYIDEINNETGLNTYEVILKIREVYSGYVLLMTDVRNRINDLIYLQLGVDGLANESTDYEILFLQVKRLLMLLKKEPAKPVSFQKTDKPIASLKLNIKNLSVVKNGVEEIELTNREYQLLSLLMEHKGTTLSYYDIYQKVWTGSASKEEADYQHLVTNIVFKLRGKLGEDSSGDEYIRTVRTRGYMLNPQIEV